LGALTLQDEAQVAKALGRRPFPAEPAFPRLPGDPEEAWLLHRGGRLARPLGQALGIEKWFRKRALSFDGKSLHTPLQDWISRLRGAPETSEKSGPPLLALNFRGSALAKGMSPFQLVLRPGAGFRLDLDGRRGGLRWSRPLNARFTAEGGLTLRSARLSRPSTCLGLRADLSSGWIFRARIGTDVGPNTLDIPWDQGHRSAPGVVLAAGIRF